jgi:hypothetical protein
MVGNWDVMASWLLLRPLVRCDKILTEIHVVVRCCGRWSGL